MKQKEGEGRSWLFIEHQGVHRPAAYDLELGSLIPLISALRAIERFPSDKKGGLHFCVIFQIRYFVLVKHCCESVFSVQKEHSSSSCSNRNIQTSWVFGFFFKETSWYFLSNIINHPPIITGAPGITSGSLLTANCEGYNTTDSKAYEFFFFYTRIVCSCLEIKIIGLLLICKIEYTWEDYILTLFGAWAYHRFHILFLDWSKY